jgi:hypothetical protein
VNVEQAKSAVRWFVSTFGGMIAGWFMAKGWFTIDQVMSVLNSPTVLSLAASLVVGVWGLFVHTQTNAVAIVDTLAKQPDSGVKAVVTEPTAAGKALAVAMPGNTTVVAGTVAAAEVAKS